LFQGRYKAILIQKDSHLLEVCGYVVLNPVRANMVEAPEAWKWSSYLATAGRVKTHLFLRRFKWVTLRSCWLAKARKLGGSMGAW
jgi:hypothetical protein